MTTHSKEPWFLPEGSTCIHNSDGEVPRSSANERRKVACVNACTDIETEVLEKYWPKGGLLPCADIHAKAELSDQLRDLCKQLASSLTYFVDKDGYASYLSDEEKESERDVVDARNLIAKTLRVLGEI